jgi:hypothetical protein
LGGLFLLGIFAYSVSEYRDFEAIAVHAPGTVLAVKHESHATGRRGNRVTIERPEVRFTPPGSTVELTATAKVMSSRSFTAGEVVDLEFDPARPTDTVRVSSGLSILEIAFGFVGLVLLGFGIAAPLRYRREVAAATAAGQKDSRRAQSSGPAAAPVREPT